MAYTTNIENGWTMTEWKQFHDLKAKANLWNLIEAQRMLVVEKSERAKRSILHAYEEGQ